MPPGWFDRTDDQSLEGKMKRLGFVLALLSVSAQAQIRFADVTQPLGLGVETSHGAAFGDFDKDGFEDVFIVHYDGPPYLFRNENGRHFINITSSSGLSAIGTMSIGALWFDMDNDGFLDLFVAGYTAPNRLFRNQGNGTFQDVSLRLPPEPLDKMTYGAAAGDYNNDGLVDLYVYNFTEGQNDQLLRNDGDSGFKDVTAEAGLSEAQAGKTRMAAWCDYDRDGDLDLYVGGQRQQILYRSENAHYYPQQYWWSDARGATWMDVNQDGFMDLNLCRSDGRIDYFLLNDQFGHLQPSPASIEQFFLPGLVNTAWSDFDNDGDLDVCAIGYGTEHRVVAVLENHGNFSFEDVTAGSGINLLLQGYNVQLTDFDNDGGCDLYLSDITLRQSLIYCNRSTRGNWLSLMLQGSVSNRAGIGAIVDLYTRDRRQTKQVESGCNGSQNGLRVSFGLGGSIRADSIFIHWPSGIFQDLYDVSANQTIKIIEQGLRPQDVAPKICSIADVPGDQGKQVRITWSASPYDRIPPSRPQILRYSVWRQDGMAIPNPDAVWKCIAEVPAAGDSLYTAIVRTTSDSSRLFGGHPFFFMVRSHTADFFGVSEPMQGYSLDNLAPQPIREIRAITFDNRHYVFWNRCPDPDWLYYTLYRTSARDTLLLGPLRDSYYVDDPVKGVTYEYAATATDSAGNESAIEVRSQAITSVFAERSASSHYALSSNFPNPFNAATLIHFAIAREEWVSIRVFNVAGEMIAVLQDGILPTGAHQVVWDGLNSQNQIVADGIYFVEMRAGAFRQIRKMILAR